MTKLKKGAFAELIRIALNEDLGSGDVTTESTIPDHTLGRARFLAKQDGVLSGLEVAESVFEKVDKDIKIEWLAKDGDSVKKGDIFGHAEGRARSLLIGERLALNLLQRMGGIASATRAMVDATGSSKSKILDTRKTVPGLRLLDKYAVVCGGGMNHRIGLYDMILIKDNHISARGGIGPALDAAQDAHRNRDIALEIETRTLEEVSEVVEYEKSKPGSVDRILLDNMVVVENGKIDTSMLQKALLVVDGLVDTEASGNVNLGTVPAISATGVDYISSGALTHSVMAMDISMKIDLIEG